MAELLGCLMPVDGGSVELERRIRRALAIYLWNGFDVSRSALNKILNMSDMDELESFWSTLKYHGCAESLKSACEAGLEVEFEMRGRGRFMLCPGDEAYPARVMSLREPPVLCVRGNVDVLSLPQVAIVGSRNVIGESMRITPKIVDDVISRGYVVTSGGAKGIDALAHGRAMERNEPTVVVSATGVEKLSPKENASIFEYAAQHGAIVSQFRSGPLNYKPNFPLRNEVIAALSDATIVVQTGRDGGALYTSTTSHRLNRPVYIAAMPGYEPLAEGNWELFRRGDVRLICRSGDLDDLNGGIQKVLFGGTGGESGAEAECGGLGANAVASHPLPPALLSQTQERILRTVSRDPKTRELIRYEIAQMGQTGGDDVPEDFDEGLIELELCGLIRFVGGRYCRT